MEYWRRPGRGRQMLYIERSRGAGGYINYNGPEFYVMRIRVSISHRSRIATSGTSNGVLTGL